MHFHIELHTHHRCYHKLRIHLHLQAPEPEKNNTMPADTLCFPLMCKQLRHQAVNMCIHLQTQEISLRSTCRRARTHCYCWGTGVTQRWWTHCLIFETPKMNVSPTWGWASVARNATARWWALEIACKDAMLAIVLGVCEHARGLCDLTNITCVSGGTDSSVTTKWTSKCHFHLMVGNRNPAS